MYKHHNFYCVEGQIKKLKYYCYNQRNKTEFVSVANSYRNMRSTNVLPRV